MRKKEPKLIITFHTTAEAIAMEKLCKENQKTGRMIPVPREISAGCGLAWCCEPDMEQEMSEFMKKWSGSCTDFRCMPTGALSYV